MFVRADGNDTIIGSIANDALSGENGNDSPSQCQRFNRGHLEGMIACLGMMVMIFFSAGLMMIFYMAVAAMILYSVRAVILFRRWRRRRYKAEFSGNFADYKITKKWVRDSD